MNVLTEAAKLPAAEREQFIADSAIRQLQNLDPTAPGAAQTRNSIEGFLKIQAANQINTNPQGAAALFGAMTLGGSRADTLRQVAMLSDPKTAYDPINLATLANQMNGQYDQATNSVRFAGSNAVMPVDQFIGFARQRAMDQTADLTPGMQRASNDAKLSAFADQTIEELRKNGILAVKNPVTNVVTPLLNLQTGQQIPQTQGPQIDVTGLDQTFGMNVNPLTSPPPQYAQMPAVTANPQPAPPLYAQQPAPVGGAAFNPQVVAQAVGIPSPLSSQSLVGDPGVQPMPVQGDTRESYQQRLLNWDAQRRQFEAQNSSMLSEVQRQQLLTQRPDLARLNLSRNLFQSPWLTQQR
jgi:hypothetical protein